MRTPFGGLRPALIALVAAIVLTVAGPATSATRHDAFPLHPGSHGQRVADLQWILGGHRPSVFREVKPTFRWQPNGAYGARTKAAVKAMKYRLGYPAFGQCGARSTQLTDTASQRLFDILEGTHKRSACEVALAASRVRAIIVTPKPTAAAVAWRSLLVSQLGISERPDGSNRGPHISVQAGGYPAYQTSTGAYGLAWCVSAEQWASLIVTGHTFADATAGVYYAVDYYAARNLVFAKAKFGSLVAFIDYDSHGVRIPGTGHMGYVVAVQANSFTYIAGNDGNAVREHTIGDGSRSYAFIRLPGVA